MRRIIPLLLFFYCCTSNEKEFVDMLSTNNPKTNSFLLQGSAALKKHNFIQALSFADSAAKYAVEKADIHFFKGRVYSELGRFKEAEQAYMKALEADDSTAKTNSVNKKKALRDAPAAKAISDADTIAKLKAAWDTSVLGDSPYA